VVPITRSHIEFARGLATGLIKTFSQSALIEPSSAFEKCRRDHESSGYVRVFTDDLLRPPWRQRQGAIDQVSCRLGHAPCAA